MDYVHDMTQVSITMPPDLQRWLDARVAEGRYVDVGDYLRDLVRRDQEAAEADAAWVRLMIEEGEASGFLDGSAEAIAEEIIAERRSRRA